MSLLMILLEFVDIHAVTDDKIVAYNLNTCYRINIICIINFFVNTLEIIKITIRMCIKRPNILKNFSFINNCKLNCALFAIPD